MSEEVVFVGRRGDPGGQEVIVRWPSGAEEPLPHLMRHSPDGFEWGYGGSGPADLARSIVGFVLQEEDPSVVAYQHVKWRAIAGLPKEGFELPASRVRELLDQIGYE